MNYWQLVPRTKDKDSGPWEDRCKYEFLNYNLTFFPRCTTKIFLDEIE